jgi:hypothetical protein
MTRLGHLSLERDGIKSPFQRSCVAQDPLDPRRPSRHSSWSENRNRWDAGGMTFKFNLRIKFSLRLNLPGQPITGPLRVNRGDALWPTSEESLAQALSSTSACRAPRGQDLAPRILVAMSTRRHVTLSSIWPAMILAGPPDISTNQFEDMSMLSRGSAA